MIRSHLEISIVSVAAAAVFLAAACVDLEPEPAEPELGHAEDPLVCDGVDDRYRFDLFANDPDLRIGAQYGRAVAGLAAPNGPRHCSASLVGPSKLLTADHCYVMPMAEATLGIGWPGALPHARGRLQDLGMSAAQAAAVPDVALTKFVCFRETTYDTEAWGHRDVDVYECAPNVIAGFGPILPGDLWGYLEARAESRDEGSDLYVLQVEPGRYFPVDTVLLGPGEVEDETDGCLFGGDYDHCFEHDGDTTPGASGGPILDADHRVFGVVHGYWNLLGPNDCPITATNYGAYLPGSGFETTWIPSDPLPSPASFATTAWAGGGGGSENTLTCPTGTLAVGVVGTTYAFDPALDARVGNLGLVCAPYQRNEDPLRRRSNRWHVIAGGSYDTILGAQWAPFNQFIHEHLDIYQNGGGMADHSQQQQSVTMCRPGHYLTGVQVLRGSYLDRVVKLECTHFDHAEWQDRAPRKAIGTSTGTSQTLRCPDTGGGNDRTPDRAVHGFTIRSGWLTDGVELHCRRF